MNTDEKRMSRWLFFTVAVSLLSGTSFGQCKGTPVLKVYYEGSGMVLNGKYLYLVACGSGEVEYDNGEFDERGTPLRKSDRLTGKQQAELAALVNEKGTRNLTGKYSGVVGFRDHNERLEVTVFRPDGQQWFTASDFYGETGKTYPPELVAFLCRIDKLRTTSDWHISDSLTCSVN
jgi:hypothetical protein